MAVYENEIQRIASKSNIARFTDFYRLPSVNHYFSNSIGDITIKHTLNRQTFYRLRAHLKCVLDGFVEQETKTKDHLWKVRPVLNSISECMQKIPCPPDHCCVDEQIIPFSGGMLNKVVIKSKPQPVGLKLFCLSHPSGTMLNFLPYVGSKTFDVNMSNMPQGEAAVLSLCQFVPKGCTIYLDRFFSGLGVLKALKEKDFT